MRNRDENKELMIREKAIAMIVNEGFDGLSMQKLAKEVNISASTIYIYFKNREDLLNKLYMGVQDKFEKDALAGFSPEMSFADGLWLQWKNRLKNINQHPVAYQFYEQFRNSPLINHEDIKPATFRKAMNDFFSNAIKRGEIKDLSPELFWAIAYGPFYTLVRFHLSNANMAGAAFSLTEKKLKKALELVLTALAT
jgi:AcrR family transcriptional regulator